MVDALLCNVTIVHTEIPVSFDTRKLGDAPILVSMLFLQDALLCRDGTLGVPAHRVQQVVVPSVLFPELLYILHSVPHVGLLGADMLQGSSYLLLLA